MPGQIESIVCPSFIKLVVDALKSTHDASWWQCVTFLSSLCSSPTQMESILGYVDNLRMIPLAFNRSNNEVSTNKSLSLHHAQHSWMQPRIWCLPQRVARRHESIIRHSGQAMARSTIMVDNVPPFIQLGIDTPTQSLGLTTTHFKVPHRKVDIMNLESHVFADKEFWGLVQLLQDFCRHFEMVIWNWKIRSWGCIYEDAPMGQPKTGLGGATWSAATK